jgi:ribonuclease BN (tRNA processing enzyme)
VAIRELEPGVRMELGAGAAIECRRVPHTPESVAYSIERGDRRIVYTGDTGPDDALADWARGCDLLVCECSLPSSMAIKEHLTPEQCAALAARAKPRHVVLTHFYPPVERVDIRAAMAAQFAGPVTLGRDGWRIELD